MKKKITLDTGKKVFPLIVMVIGLALMLAMWIVRLNMVAIVSVGSVSYTHLTLPTICSV